MQGVELTVRLLFLFLHSVQINLPSDTAVRMPETNGNLGKRDACLREHRTMAVTKCMRAYDPIKSLL